MDLTFKTEKKSSGLRYLSFLPKNLRSIGAISIFINVLTILISVIFYTGLQKAIPLFYSLPSDQQLVNKNLIFILPGLATFINLIHLAIAYLEKEINLSILKMFVEITLLLQVLVLAILLRVIIIVN